MARIKKRAEAAHEREQQTHRQAEAVKERHGVEHQVVVLQVADGEHLADVGQQIGVRQFHSLRRAFRATGEQNDRGRLRIGERRAREPHETTPRTQFADGADVAAHILQKDQLDAGGREELQLEPGLLHEGA